MSGETTVRARLAALDPYWGPQLVVAAAIALDFLLPDKLSVGPFWLFPAIELLLLVGLAAISPHPRVRHTPLRRRIALGLTAFVSAVNLISLGLLVHFLLHHGKVSVNGDALIRSGVALWVTNVLLFGLWFWELDRGGPLARATGEMRLPDLQFPQMVQPDQAPDGWMPGLIDYLYTSFTNASAFSPTDTMPLTAMAKVLFTAQASAALVTVGLVVARAVNILA